MAQSFSTGMEKTKTGQHYSWMTAILFWCGLVIVSSNYLTIPMISIFTEVFQVSTAQAAWTGSAFSLFYAIGSLFSGPLSDRFGRKQVILIGLLILALITVILGFVHHLVALIMLRSIQGLAAASFAPVAIAYVVDKFPTQRIMTTIGFVSSGFLLSGIVGQIVSSYISQQFGWQSVFYYFGVIYVLIAVVVALFIPKVKAQQQDGNVLSMFKQFGKVLSQKSLINCYLITVTLLLTFVGMYTALGSYLSETFGLSDQDILYVRAIGIIGMLLAPFAGNFVAKFGLYRVLRGGITLAMVGLAILGGSSNLPFLVAMSVVFVAGIALTVPSLISLVGELGGKEHGAAVSLYAFILFIGTSIGPIITVALLQTGSYLLTYEVLALLLGMSLAISFLIRAKETARG